MIFKKMIMILLLMVTLVMMISIVILTLIMMILIVMKTLVMIIMISIAHFDINYDIISTNSHDGGIGNRYDINIDFEIDKIMILTLTIITVITVSRTHTQRRTASLYRFYKAPPPLVC